MFDAEFVGTLGEWLQFGVLGLSGVLALLGTVIYLTSIRPFNAQKVAAAKFFLVFSLFFLVLATTATIADRMLIPKATIKVEIEPWDASTISSWDLEGEFFVETPERKIAYRDEAVEATVGTGSKIECEVYPLYQQLRRVQKLLANVSASLADSKNDVGIVSEPR
jgi:hypothetical protein